MSQNLPPGQNCHLISHLARVLQTLTRYYCREGIIGGDLKYE